MSFDKKRATGRGSRRRIHPWCGTGSACRCALEYEASIPRKLNLHHSPTSQAQAQWTSAHMEELYKGKARRSQPRVLAMNGEWLLSNMANTYHTLPRSSLNAKQQHSSPFVKSSNVPSISTPKCALDLHLSAGQIDALPLSASLTAKRNKTKQEHAQVWKSFRP